MSDEVIRSTVRDDAGALAEYAAVKTLKEATEAVVESFAPDLAAAQDAVGKVETKRQEVEDNTEAAAGSANTAGIKAAQAGSYRNETEIFRNDVAGNTAVVVTKAGEAAASAATALAARDVAAAAGKFYVSVVAANADAGLAAGASFSAPESNGDIGIYIKPGVAGTPATRLQLVTNIIPGFMTVDETSYYQGKLVIAAVDGTFGAETFTAAIRTADGYLYDKLAVRIGVSNGLTWSLGVDGFWTINFGSVEGSFPTGSFGDTLDAYAGGAWGPTVGGTEDANGYLAFDVRQDGTVAIPRPRMGGRLGLQQVLDTASYLFETREDANRVSQIYRTSKTTGVTVPVTSLGSNGGMSLSWDEANLIYGTDRFPALQALMYQPVVGGSEYRVFPLRSVIVTGDSLAAGSGISVAGKDFPSRLVALANRETRNYGYGGQPMRSYAARLGAYPTVLTVTGGFIPTSGSVACTSVTPDLLMSASGGPNPLRGWIVGVYGNLIWTSGNYAFTPINYPAAPVAVPAGSPFIVDTRAWDEWTQVLWLGDYEPLTPLDQLLSDVAAIVASPKTLIKRVLILGTVNNSADPVGSPNCTGVINVNSSLAAIYGDRFLDVRSELIARGLSIAGITPTTQDLADVANGVVPSSLRSDSIHLNDSGYFVVAYLVAERLALLGW